MDCHLSWKDHVSHISKKIKRNIGALSKIRHFVSLDILKSLYYALIFPFLTYCLVAWGNTYSSSLLPLYNLQKRVIRIITFSDYILSLKIIKLYDLVYFQTALFMCNYHYNNLPESFNSFFHVVTDKHDYNTRFAVAWVNIFYSKV